MDDEGDLQPARRYPPLQRTPPDYQTFIKFLVMASILDSVWVSGPRQTGSPCGLTAMARPARRPLDLSPEPASPNHHNNNHLHHHHNNNNGSSRLPADVEETLLQLNITPADYLRRPDELRTTGPAPTALRVLSVLLFNAFVVWSNLGAALVGAPEASRRPQPAPSRWLAGGPGVGADPATWRLDAEKGAKGVEEVTVRAAAAEAAARTRTASRLAAEDAARARTASRLAAEEAEYDTVVVPWYIQLAYFATLVVLVVGLPCCPAVLENACGFLMC